MVQRIYFEFEQTFGQISKNYSVKNNQIPCTHSKQWISQRQHRPRLLLTSRTPPVVFGLLTPHESPVVVPFGGD